MLLGCHAFTDRFWLSARLIVCAPFFSALLTGIFAFTDINTYILKLGSPLGILLILDMYYVVTSLVSRSPHTWAVFSHIAGHGALVCHPFKKDDCVLIDSGLNKSCIKLVLLSFCEDITLLPIATYRMTSLLFS